MSRPTPEVLLGDEGKPECRNCIRKGSLCQYGPVLTFLSKNAYTVQHPDQQHVDPSRDRRDYEFVNASPSKTTEDQSSAVLSTAKNGNGSSFNESKVSSQPCSPNGVSNGNVAAQAPNETTSPKEGNTAAAGGLLTLNLTVSSVRSSAMFAVNHSADETTENFSSNMSDLHQRSEAPSIDALLRLPTENISREHSSSSFCNDTLGNLDGPLTSPLRQNELLLGPRDTGFCSSAVMQGEQQERGDIHALQHYRYEVATWLDICDTSQSFGIAAIQLAVGAAPFGPHPDVHILSEILSFKKFSPKSPNLGLSMRIYSINTDTTLGETPSNTLNLEGSHENADQLRQVEMHPTSLALTTSLKRVHTLISNTYCAWTKTEMSLDHSNLVGSLIPYALEKSLRSAIFWLTLRLDLSVALINPTSRLLSLLTTITIQNFDLYSRNNVENEVFYHAHVPLVLCVQAAVFYNGGTSGVSSTHRTIEKWLELTHELNQWYSRRNSLFQPVTDLESHERDFSDFPVILFTSGAGVFGNQLYHTAMYLLLQKKPRTAQLLHIHSAARSILWHTRRICGMALHNDRRQCWDFSLLSSLFIAAKTMTYRSQQVDILQGIHRIAALQAEWLKMEDFRGWA
ncbi:hypothetical protein UA08_03698 [Talaromyces atroroseus]|uniref:Transcription factor domain-containing protein n=1 Tax=Talaromyces atroroseus TaxID=1441469 RepID=A0A225AHN8_TALAT|nr:hypothetical protein UA08_03698 [Talaromyces atroroseus]OKL60962.1 hypothetical protein UA08_03698 [Talaromyces atroroseus]